jgi:FkbM family methyltransferase
MQRNLLQAKEKGISKMKRHLLTAYLAVRRFIYIHLLGDQFEREVARWFRDKGDSSLRLSYPLDQNSIVFDCGGYQGDWAASIFERYHSTIYIFEPVKEFYQQIVNRFSGQSKIYVFHFGLHRRTESTEIMINRNASSVFCSTGKSEPIILIDIKDFMQEHQISRVDLLKINIEGGEFDLLDRILETGLIHYIDNLQIQFHRFVPNAEEQRRRIQKRLGVTHRLTYNYMFVWENWEKTT